MVYKPTPEGNVFWDVTSCGLIALYGCFR